MLNFTEKLQTKMFTSLDAIGSSTNEGGLELHYFSEAVPVVKNILMELKIFIYQYKFRDKEEEILFYKELSPLFVAEYIYHLNMKELCFSLPADPTRRKKVISSEIKNINRFCARNLTLYKYFRKGETIMDSYYFTRKSYQIDVFSDGTNSVLDELFVTPAGHRFAQFRALERMIVVLDDLKEHKDKAQRKLCNSKYSWTDNKLGLIEIVYALYFSGCINQGNVSIKELADFIGSMFNVNLDNIYRLKQQFLTRKNSSAYLDHLKLLFIKGLQDQDDRYLSR